METLINYTNAKLINWYANAKEYGVIGSGTVRFSEGMVYIDYIENGIKNTWSMVFYPEYLKTQKIDWVFNCWMELV